MQAALKNLKLEELQEWFVSTDESSSGVASYMMFCP
jgi:hypothetical protein